MADTELSKGDLFSLFTKEERYSNPINGVYQIFNTKKNDGTSTNRKNIVLMSDGVYYMKMLFRNEAADKFQSQELQKGDIVRITAADAVSLKNKTRFVVLVDDFELVDAGKELVNPNSTFLNTYMAAHINELVPELKGDDEANDAHPAAENSTTTGISGTATNSGAAAASATNSMTGQSDRPLGNPATSFGNSSKSKPIFAIEQLSPYQNVWTIKARVSFKGEIKTWSNQRGEGKLFNVNFLDTSGEIRATAFNDMATKYYEILQEGKVYYVSKARLQPAKPQFSNLSHPYELSLDRESVVEECQDDINVPKTHFNFIKLDTVQNQEANSTVDVLGIIKTVNDAFTLTSRAGKTFDRRDIVLVDDSNSSINVGLWNTLAKEFNMPEGSVVAIKGVRVSDFGGKSLTMGFTSNLIPNPEIPEAYALKGWYDSEGHSANFTALGQDNVPGASPNAGKFIAQRISIGKAIADNLGKSDAGDYFSIRAAISFLKVDNFAYPACSNKDCNKKAIQSTDGTWRCEKCNTDNEKPEWRYILTLSIMDETGQLWVVLFNEQAEQLLGVSATKLTDLKEKDPKEFSRLTQNLQMNQYDFRIRAREDNYNDQTRIRYSVSNIHQLNYKAEADFLAAELSKAFLE
ncbi:replication factor A subunit protein RFA1 KNAG_0B05560 [Huiozyma naganishii CBS 8797]|uniref:Replication protein A subunit n=1 Tax=Huiozyma naganishii (strain ATCC MYA-139 / BCRC 22969 / CBS 8797 / KCTC 17520 / NBRC 10181 / NCYC 3082 / Yp74L-3) TaxID=1071383 RepID=J7S406_HUIN7|nr:hypothetical protein KNAG_0B05560 [Kazachstania naganishii CBS 8797]CCK68989.1 hypothetical protein KNAG_0B05560 [Kazachstania naganishii CBS 8797]